MRRALLAVCSLVLAAGCGSEPEDARPVLRLAPGERGPLVLDEPVRVAGEPGSVVRGGIRITSDDVEVSGVTVRGGELGIEVQGARGVVLDDVTVEGAELDGIQLRRASAEIRDCTVRGLRHERAQGIDVSFSFDMEPTVIEGCTVEGGWEGIVTHSARVEVRGNDVRDTTLRGISITEMSDGEVAGNSVADALGIAIFCGDYSHCEVTGNEISGTRADPESGDTTRGGHAVQSRFFAEATVEDNRLSGNAGGMSAVVDGRIMRR